MSWRDLFRPPAPPVLPEVGASYFSRRAIGYYLDADGQTTLDPKRAASWRTASAVSSDLLSEVIAVSEEGVTVTLFCDPLGRQHDPVTLTFTPAQFAKRFKFACGPLSLQI